MVYKKESMGFPGGSVVKNPSASAEATGSVPWSARSPGEGNGNPTILVWKIHGQRIQANYSPWGHKRSQT